MASSRLSFSLLFPAILLVILMSLCAHASEETAVDELYDVDELYAKATDPTKEHYEYIWFNHITQENSEEKPEHLKDLFHDDDVPETNGRKYYVDPDTGISSWDLPEHLAWEHHTVDEPEGGEKSFWLNTATGVEADTVEPEFGWERIATLSQVIDEPDSSTEASEDTRDWRERFNVNDIKREVIGWDGPKFEVREEGSNWFDLSDTDHNVWSMGMKSSGGSDERSG